MIESYWKCLANCPGTLLEEDLHRDGLDCQKQPSTGLSLIGTLNLTLSI